MAEVSYINPLSNEGRQIIREYGDLNKIFEEDEQLIEEVMHTTNQRISDDSLIPKSYSDYAMKRIQWAIEKKNNKNFTQAEFEYLTNSELFMQDVVIFHILCQAIAIQFNVGSRETRLFIESQGTLIQERLAKIPPMARADIIDEVLDEVKTDGTIRNLSFIATNDDYSGSTGQSYSYAVHIDFGNCKPKFENCYLYSTNGPAIGIGLSSNMEIAFDDCDFVHNKTGENGTSALGAFYLHTEGSTSAVGQKLIMNNCRAINKTGTNGICLHELSAGSEQYALLTNNVFWGTSGAVADIQGTWIYDYSYGNNVSLS